MVCAGRRYYYAYTVHAVTAPGSQCVVDFHSVWNSGFLFFYQSLTDGPGYVTAKQDYEIVENSPDQKRFTTGGWYSEKIAFIKKPG